MEDKPRYSRVSDIIDLATFMASKIQGITINDIIERYHVSRRTAERMRDSLLNIFPQIIEIETDEKHKHWGFSDYSIKELIHFSSNEIANLEQLKRRTTNKETQEHLEKTIAKLKTLSTKHLNSVENNVEMIMQSEGYALRQMPQYKISNETLITIREAIKNSKVVKGTYHNKERFIESLGLIYGEKIYLVAREKAKGNDIYNYLLHKFSDLSLTDKTFDRKDFNLEEYNKQSFGVYHGEILNVKLLFDKEIAEEVLNYNFHPTQKVKQNEDGTVTVKFCASGDLSIMWHIFKWGTSVKILAPASLKKEYTKMLKDILEKNSKK